MADDKIPTAEAEDLVEGFALDMTAIFRMIEDDHMAIIKKGTAEGWTPEKLIQELEGILDGEDLL